MFMINLHVYYLDGFIEKLKSADIKIHDERMREGYDKITKLEDSMVNAEER